MTKADKTENPADAQIRSSVMLVFGRYISLVINLATQIAAARYLSKTDYGIFTYVLEILAMLTIVNTFGLERAVGRFIPYYEEKGDLARLTGTLLFSLLNIIGFGVAIVVAAFALNGAMGGSLLESPAAFSTLLIMIALAPTTALDNVLISLLAAFGKAPVIVIRRHLLGPLLKLAAVGLTIALGESLGFLAASYTVAGVVGILLYGAVLPRIFAERKIIAALVSKAFTVDARSLYSFMVPTLGSDFAVTAKSTVVTMLLAYYHDFSVVAAYTIVLPLARLNGVVLKSFTSMFAPMITRLHVRGGIPALGAAQTQTGLWISVLSFPTFAACIALGEELVSLLFGSQYASSAPVLGYLAAAYFLTAAPGLNIRTLRALGKVKLMLLIDLSALLIAVVLGVLLIPEYGALGAAWAYMTTLLARSLFSMIELWLVTKRNPFSAALLRCNGTILAMTAVLVWIEFGTRASPVISAAAVVATSAVVVAVTMRDLKVNSVFPEGSRLRRLLDRLTLSR